MAAVTNLSARLVQRSLQSCMRAFMMGSIPQAGQLQRSHNVPKRPPTAYTAFVHDRFPALRQANIGLPATSLMRMAGELWNNLPPMEKNRYADDYQKNLAVYKDAFNKLPESQKAEIRQQSHIKRVEKKKRRVKKLASDLGKPKRVPTAYLLYFKSRLDGLDNNLKLTEKSRLVAEEWKSMSAAQRQPYLDEYMARKQEYNYEMEVWEDRMKMVGHPELIRGYKAAPPKKPAKKKASAKKAKKKSTKGKTKAKKGKSKKAEE